MRLRVCIVIVCMMFISIYSNQSIHAHTIDGDITLYDDWVIDGDAVITHGNVDLNGYTLTITGNLTQSGGLLSFSNGSLIVEGDFTVTNSPAIVHMLNDGDLLHVVGTFSFQGRSSLLAGTMIFEGNFTQNRNTYYQSTVWDNFRPEGTHHVIFDGEGTQTVSFNTSRPNNAWFWHVTIQNENVVAETVALDCRNPNN